MTLRLGLVACVWLLGFAAQAQVDPNRSVIVINGEEIKGAEYYRRMEFLPQVGRVMGGTVQEAPPGMLTLQTLIEERLLLQLARQKKVYPTDAEVQAQLNERKAVEPNFVEKWVAMGLRKEDLDVQMRIELCQFKLQTLGITITDMEVEKHYKDNPTLFTVPKRFKLRMVVVKEPGKAAVDADLKAGMAFPEAAKKHSVDPSKADGGAIGSVAEDEFAPPVKKALGLVKIGQVTDWIEGGESWVKFFIEDVEASKLLPLDATLKSQVRKSLMVDRGRVKNDVDKMIREMRAKAVIQLKQPQFESDIKKLLDSYKIGA